MSKLHCRFTVPPELKAYYKVSKMIEPKEPEPVPNFNSDLVINRDSRGCVVSVCYYSPERDLVKQVFYKGENISRINYYKDNSLHQIEDYNNGFVTSKKVFKSTGYLLYSITYGYNRKNQLIKICKNSQNRDIEALFDYDDLGRIMKRKIYVNKKEIIEQNYRYDVLDRLIEYRDDNQKIVVSHVSKNNELISYVITDIMGNDIAVENNFTDCGYDNTVITINGHTSTVKDLSYVDNVMLKKPYTTEDDLDLIISNLMRNEDKPLRTSREEAVEQAALRIINKGIECRALPISMRKRLMYSLAIQG